MFAFQYLFTLVNIYFRNSFLKIFPFPERNTRENVGTFSERFSAGAFFRRFLIEINCPLVSLSLSGFSRKCFKYLTKNLDQRICFVFYSSHLTTVTTIKCWGKEADYSRETLTLFELIAITFFIQNDSP